MTRQVIESKKHSVQSFHYGIRYAITNIMNFMMTNTNRRHHNGRGSVKSRNKTKLKPNESPGNSRNWFSTGCTYLARNVSCLWYRRSLSSPCRANAGAVVFCLPTSLYHFLKLKVITWSSNYMKDETVRRLGQVTDLRVHAVVHDDVKPPTSSLQNDYSLSRGNRKLSKMRSIPVTVLTHVLCSACKRTRCTPAQCSHDQNDGIHLFLCARRHDRIELWKCWLWKI